MKNNFGNRYDNLHGGWRLPCSELEAPVLIQPLHIRRVSPMEGATSPHVMIIDYACSACHDIHRSLMTTRELDYDPLFDYLSPTLDLKTGEHRFDGDLLQSRWLKDLTKKGTWPWSWNCPRHHKVIPASPSQIKALEPGYSEQYLLSYTCPHCEKDNSELWHANKLLAYPPL